MRLIPGLMRMFSSPVSLCIIIIAQILLCSLEVLIHKNNIWLNFVFLLIFFGGLMVLFMYVRRVSQNEILRGHFWLLPFGCLRVVFFQIDYLNISSSRGCRGELCFNRLGWWLASLLILYLFTTIILVVKITNPCRGALRVE